MEIIKKLFNKTNYKNKLTVYIDGMSCKHCAARIENAFNSLGDTSTQVKLEEKCAIISTNKELTEDEIEKLVTDTGFVFVKSER